LLSGLSESIEDFVSSSDIVNVRLSNVLKRRGVVDRRSESALFLALVILVLMGIPVGLVLEPALGLAREEVQAFVSVALFLLSAVLVVQGLWGKGAPLNLSILQLLSLFFKILFIMLRNKENLNQ